MEKKNQILFIVVVATLLQACGILHNGKTKKELAANPVEVYENYDQALQSKKETLLVIGFADNDAAYTAPITQTLKIDSTKNDLSIHSVLARDFAVVKLKRSTFGTMMSQPEKYPRWESSDTTYREEMDANQSYIFITGKERMYIYGLITTQAAKATIHDLIWVKFGP